MEMPATATNWAYVGARRQETHPERVLAHVLRQERIRYQTRPLALQPTAGYHVPSHHALLRVLDCQRDHHGCRHTSGYDHQLQPPDPQLVKLVEGGWRVLTVWTCAMRGRDGWRDEELAVIVGGWLASDEVWDEVAGRL